MANIFDDEYPFGAAGGTLYKPADLFSCSMLAQAYAVKISKKASKGIDGMTRLNFNFDDEVEAVSRKCISGEFRFAPYLQKLALKGAGKAPRVISVPTVRDQLVLYVLKEFLHHLFPECVNKTLPNKYIRDIWKFLCSENTDKTLCYSKFDITDFYGNIAHERLLKILDHRIKDPDVLGMVAKAIKNITIPPTARTKDYKAYKPSKGIPQGLSISNILANIYVYDFDRDVGGKVKKYFRYVDDILIFNAGETKQCIKPVLEESLNLIELPLSESKTGCKSTMPTFDYLGYHFAYPVLSVKQAGVDKFLNSIAARFTAFKSNRKYTLDNHKWMTSELYNRVFVEALNIRITGAISEKKKYGWVFYYLEMNDLTLLNSIDSVISKFFAKIPEFGAKAPKNLKRISRAYHEARNSPLGGYIHNYDKIQNTKDKLDYLIKMGIVDPKTDPLLPSQIDKMYDKAKAYYLAILELDIGGLS